MSDFSWVCLVGAPIVGSFLTTLVTRLPLGEPITIGRSRCRRCGERISPKDLVPIVSWLLLRGRCGHCGDRISVLYPLIEVSALVVAVWAFLVLDGWLVWWGCVLGWGLLAIAVIDWRHFVVPDLVVLPLAGLGLGMAAAMFPDRLIDHALAAVGGYAAFRMIGLAYTAVRKREGLGIGDAKLLAAAGAWVSWTGLASVVIWACGLAVAVLLGQMCFGKRLSAADRIPFGAYLSAGTWLVWLYGPWEFS